MAIIIETCPKCGHDLTDLVIATYPPIPQKKCFNCGWSWEGKREEVIRVPFDDNYLEMINKSFTNDPCINCSNNPKNGGNGVCHCILGQIQIT